MTRTLTIAAIGAALLAGTAHAQSVQTPPSRGAAGEEAGTAPRNYYGGIDANRGPGIAAPGVGSGSTGSAAVRGRMPDPAPTSGAAGEEFGTAPRDYNGSPEIRGGGGVDPTAGTGADGRVIARVTDIPNYDGRMEPSQTRLALLQTTMLNTLSGLGFQSMRDFRKQGERYYTEALTSDGNWRTVELDPTAGTIAYVR